MNRRRMSARAVKFLRSPGVQFTLAGSWFTGQAVALAGSPNAPELQAGTGAALGVLIFLIGQAAARATGRKLTRAWSRSRMRPVSAGR